MSDKLSIYLGAPLFTPVQRQVLDHLTELFEKAGYIVFSPLEESKPIWKGRAPAACSPEDRRAVVESNYRGIGQCDIMFAWLGGWNPAASILKSGMIDVTDQEDYDNLQKMSPALPDVGVVWELGYAFAIDKPILGYLHDGEEERNFNLMLSETMDGVARGSEQLMSQLEYFKENEVFQSENALATEPEEMPV